MSTGSTDRIERTIELRVPRSRVWRALTDAHEFGTWFGVKMDGAFSPGAQLRGQITIPGYQHVVMDIRIERVEPERHFSWRWHPHAVERGVDYSKEERTLVVFELADVPGGTRLTVVESGFDKVPLARRAEAYRMNSGGWEGQLRNLEQHVTESSTKTAR
ncbi:MAG: SRPBCC family protein [Planctomycetota bacterium]